MYIFVCENSIDGILTGVYDAFAFKVAHRDTLKEQDIGLSCHPDANYQLFTEYIPVPASFEKAAKVRNTLYEKLGEEFYETIVSAILAVDTSGKKNSMDKANAVYFTICYALKKPQGSDIPFGASVLHYLGNPYIHRVFDLSRATHNEAHHLLGFLRFQELANGVLFSVIHPQNHCLPILAEHFTDRLPQENFLIYDETHKLAAVHKSGTYYALTDASDLNQEILTQLSEKESLYQELWLTFFEHIAIEARKNPKLQAQNIPKRFWKDTVELSHLVK